MVIQVLGVWFFKCLGVWFFKCLGVWLLNYKGCGLMVGVFYIDKVALVWFFTF